MTDDNWKTTADDGFEQYTEPGDFEKAIDGLEPGEEYEFRAATGNAGAGITRATGETKTFTPTADEPDPEPDPEPPMKGDYERITARGQTINISSGQTWENKLIDFGERNEISIVAKGTDWTIRNIGFTGTIPYNTAVFGVADSGDGTSTMENIYFGESTGEQPADIRSICIWVDPRHSGTLNVTNVNFNVPGNNGIYGSAPGSNGNGKRGDVHIDGCYGNDRHHTAFRISDNGDSVTNSVAYKSGERTANRGVWVWNGPNKSATIKNVDVITNGEGDGVVTSSPKGEPTVEMTNVCTDDGTGTGCAPTDEVPEGCPTTAEQAARGNSLRPMPPEDPDDKPWKDDDNYIEDANKSEWETRVTFNFQTGSGQYELWSDKQIYQAYWAAQVSYNSNIEFGREDGYYYAKGSIENDLDGLVTDGEIEAITASGDANEIWYNGEKIDADDYPNKPGEDAPKDGDEGSGGSDYEVIKARGQTITLGNGDVWENKLVDLSTGQGILLFVKGAATIRNIGFDGVYRGDNFLASITAPSGKVVFENIYAADGATKEGTSFVHGAGGFFYHKRAGADVEFNRCHVQGFPNNGFYCSNSPSGGEITWKRCYGKNNGVSTFRCGGSGDQIIECAATNDNTDYGPGYSTGWVESSGRPFWVWPGGRVSIKDSHFAAGDYPYAGVMRGGSRGAMTGGAVDGPIHRSHLLERSNVGTNPDLDPANYGVPLSAEEAASGGADAPEPPEEPTDPEPPTCEERLEQARLRNEQLQEQLDDYHDAFEELEGAIDIGEENLPMYKGIWNYLRSKIPKGGE